jgi:hypothetical protein
MNIERPLPAVDQLPNKWQLLRRMAREAHIVTEAAHRSLLAIPDAIHDDVASEQFEALKTAALERIRRTAAAADDYARTEEQAVNTAAAEMLCEMGKPELAKHAFK